MPVPRLIPSVLDQHCEEAAFLWTLRRRFLARADISLADLTAIDERIDAHLEGIRTAQERGWKASQKTLAKVGVGEVFACATLALEFNASERITPLLATVEAEPLFWPGLVSALGWASPQDLQGWVKALLGADSSFHRRIGIASCAMHRVDPGGAVNTAISSPDASLRTATLRCAGEIGRRDLSLSCAEHLKDADPACAFWAAWSATLLGDRGVAVESFRHLCFSPGRYRERALRLVLMALSVQDAHGLLKALAPDPANQRTVIQGVGVAGDPFYIPWLIKQMSDDKLTRLAGESFSFITGLDPASLDLERKSPEGVELGPTDNPEDEDIAMDADYSLPWLDPPKIRKWWDANKRNFQNGVRYFMGEPVNIDNCKRVLRDGYQRQRIAAALYLSLLKPGTPLFPTSAPAWRQQRWLAKMG